MAHTNPPCCRASAHVPILPVWLAILGSWRRHAIIRSQLPKDSQFFYRTCQSITRRRHATRMACSASPATARCWRQVLRSVTACLRDLSRSAPAAHRARAFGIVREEYVGRQEAALTSSFTPRCTVRCRGYDASRSLHGSTPRCQQRGPSGPSRQQMSFCC